MAAAQTETCQNCKQSFVIDPEDFDFYAKIKVPPPTFCPDCRQQRRYAFFNLFPLYKRACDLCHKESFSSYPPESPYVVYCPKCWWSDKWDPRSYGADYDFNRPFFEQFDELMHRVPHLGLAVEMSAAETSPYMNYGGSDKNCYLVFNAEFNEDCLNGFYLFHTKSALDTSLAIETEKMYDSMHVWKVNNGTGLRYQVTESVDVGFLRDSRNCQDCFVSANLRNKKYHIFNKAYSKEEYQEERKKWDLGSYKQYRELAERAEKHWDALPYKSLYQDMAVNCTGNQIFECRNCRDCFEIMRCENCRYVRQGDNIKSAYDVTAWSGVEGAYDSMAIGAQAANIRFTALGAIGATNFEYSFLAIAGNDLFGCVSMKKGSHCILNKQYSEQEFRELAPKIREHMAAMPYEDSRGRTYGYGEFFPIEISPFGYNETIAQNFHPMKPEEAKREGYKWYEGGRAPHEITKRAEDLPDHVKDAGDDILKEAIGCARCGRAFRMPPMELQILRARNLPLPRWCPMCRIESKYDIWVKESRLLPFECPQCGVKTQISENLIGKSKVYCEGCYNKEVI